MTLQGDLSTLDLAGLLQNLETHKKSGVLSLECVAGMRQLYFDGGMITLLTYEGRASLMDVLVASHAISVNDLEGAKKKRRRSGKSLGEVLVASGKLTAEYLHQIASARILDEACELVAIEVGAFKFTEGAIPRGIFDPEERRLKLRLPAGPLLMESARRQDHWRLIRQRVPADSAHFVVQQPPREPQEPIYVQLQAEIVPDLDGTKSVTEVMARFPHRRFEAYQLLSELVESRAVRETSPADLARVAQQTGVHDQERAREVIDRGLAANPRNLELLAAKVELAESTGELEQAADALKMRVHMLFESGEDEVAREELEHLKELAPGDPAVWEKSFVLALEEERVQDAIAEGKELARLYREPGLFNKAREVLEQVVDLAPDDWELLQELARTYADSGERDMAVRRLERFGDARLAEEQYPLAARVFEEVLNIHPKRKSAQKTLELIQSGEAQRRRQRIRRLKRRVALIIAIGAMVTWLVYEGVARGAYVEAEREVSRQELIEDGRYVDAADLFENVRERYPFATAAYVDARLRIRELSRKATD